MRLPLTGTVLAVGGIALLVVAYFTHSPVVFVPGVVCVGISVDCLRP